MAEPEISGHLLLELSQVAAYRDAINRVESPREAVVDALGSLVGHTIDVEGYPFDVLYALSPHPTTGMPRLGSSPAYPIFRTEDEPRLPRTFINRQLLSANSSGIQISAVPRVMSESLERAEPLKLVAYTFRLHDILSVSIAKQVQ